MIIKANTEIPIEGRVDGTPSAITHGEAIIIMQFSELVDIGDSDSVGSALLDVVAKHLGVPLPTITGAGYIEDDDDDSYARDIKLVSAIDNTLEISVKFIIFTELEE